MFYVNPDLIEIIEARPDTTVTLVNKHRYVVEDGVDTIVDRIVAYRARIADATSTSDDHTAGVRTLAATDSHDREQAA